MKTATGSACAVAAAAASILAVAGCGSGASASRSNADSPARTAGGTVRLLMGTAPDSLDPGSSITSQGQEADWLAYTGLLSYAHASGEAGSRLIPALATSLPTVSADGRTYKLTLRRGLVYSDGRPVKAGDFAYTVERTIKIPWGLAGTFLTNQIAGAAAYSKGKATTISGITTDDATGAITIRLTAPYGPFANVLAFPALGLVPSGTPMKNLANDPPPGVGPYKIAGVVPDRSFTLVKNPRWTPIRGIPEPQADVQVKVDSNLSANALAVLQNSADVFDWADTIPAGLMSRVQAQAKGRFSKQIMGSTYYVFMNTRRKPFSSAMARQAVVTGLDRDAMNRLGAGTLQPGCYLLPPQMTGHPTAPCPYGDPAGKGDLAKAKALVQQSGMAGQPVTVWSQNRSPRREWMTYYAQLLNEIGFKATLKVVSDAIYFATIGNLGVNAQTGFSDWNQDFPNPVDFYLSLQGSSISRTNNLNFGQVNDTRINSAARDLGNVPSGRLASVADQWQQLDEYVAKQAYMGVFGYETFPGLTSTRLDQHALIFNPEYGWDWTSFRLKS